MIDLDTRQAERMSRTELERRGARFCADCGSHREYALLEVSDRLAAYRMEGDDGRRVAEAEDRESAAQLGRLVDFVL